MHKVPDGQRTENVNVQKTGSKPQSTRWLPDVGGCLIISSELHNKRHRARAKRSTADTVGSRKHGFQSASIRGRAIWVKIPFR